LVCLIFSSVNGFSSQSWLISCLSSFFILLFENKSLISFLHSINILFFYFSFWILSFCLFFGFIF
jgi:hypothetical protein